MSLILILVGAVCFIGAYFTYGNWLTKQWGVDPDRPTPSHTLEDGVDYVPTKPQILIGHHFSSIAGAGPILGPIQASVFGWLPTVIWIIIGGIFFGGVHDYGSLVASVRHDGRSIGEVIHKNMGKKGKTLFEIFSWLTLVLVVAAFSSICATSFEASPEAGTTSLLFIGLAVIFGILIYRVKMPLGIATILGIIGMIGCIYLGMTFPLKLSAATWIWIMLVYIAVASIVPVWILLQPRDYLNSFILYAMMAGAIIGVLVYRPNIKLDAVTSFNPAPGQYLFPLLFVTVACGAISGFHSLVSSGTTAKQIASEKDAKFIGYGSMLIECMLAIVAVITAAYLTDGEFTELMKKGPIVVFSTGVATFMNSFGVPFHGARIFVTLAISAFALTSLDTSTRLGRFVFQEYFMKENEDGTPAKQQPILANKYVATVITVFCGGLLAFMGYAKVWPIFGSANQLLAALALMAVAVWLMKTGKGYKMIIAPMAFMFLVTLTALVLLAYNNIKLFMHPLATTSVAGVVALIVLSVLLFILAIVLLREAIKIFKTQRPVE